jgi:hypothetical protein
MRESVMTIDGDLFQMVLCGGNPAPSHSNRQAGHG